MKEQKLNWSWIKLNELMKFDSISASSARKECCWNETELMNN